MLEAKNVVKTFDGFRALDGATMTVPQGAVYGLVGPNGAGKSTIIRHLTGVYRPDSGELLLDGQPVWENPAVKRRMAVIGDDWYYFPQSSIAAQNCLKYELSDDIIQRRRNADLRSDGFG